VFLHELVHAWFHQYHDNLDRKFPSCDLAERFADAGFAALGGRRRDPNVCGSFRLPAEVAAKKLAAFQQLAHTLLQSRSANILRWQPPEWS
jgi:hypothetical protein